MPPSTNITSVGIDAFSPVMSFHFFHNSTPVGILETLNG